MSIKVANLKNLIMGGGRQHFFYKSRYGIVHKEIKPKT
jgi:hypothetical protein